MSHCIITRGLRRSAKGKPDQNKTVRIEVLVLQIWHNLGITMKYIHTRQIGIVYRVVLSKDWTTAVRPRGPRPVVDNLPTMRICLCDSSYLHVVPSLEQAPI